jgi:hypothetical protein
MFPGKMVDVIVDAGMLGRRMQDDIADGGMLGMNDTGCRNAVGDEGFWDFAGK